MGRLVICNGHRFCRGSTSVLTHYCAMVAWLPWTSFAFQVGGIWDCAAPESFVSAGHLSLHVASAWFDVHDISCKGCPT